MTKTVVGSFDSLSEAHRVVDELRTLGMASDDVSLVANNTTGSSGATTGATASTGAAMGTADTPASWQDSSNTHTTVHDVGTGAVAGGVIGGAAGLLAALVGLTLPGIGPIVAAGPLAAALTGAGVGAIAGGLAGGLRHLGVPDTHADYYAEAVRRGGALVTVRADDARADEVAALMQRHGAHDIEDRVSQWKSSGWTGHDPSAAPYSYGDIERERTSYRGTQGGVDRPGLGDDLQRAGSATRGAASRAGDAIERAIPGDSDRDGK